MKTRTVILTIQSIVEIFRDYFPDEDIPADAKAIKLFFHPTERKFKIIIVSDSIPTGAPPLEAKFENRRIFSV